jgi:hypothetical protein
VYVPQSFGGDRKQQDIYASYDLGIRQFGADGFDSVREYVFFEVMGVLFGEMKGVKTLKTVSWSFSGSRSEDELYLSR